MELSQYCFTRNKLFLTSDLVPPHENIARIVEFFHHLPHSSKHQVLPVLKQLFASSYDSANSEFEEEVQQWLTEIAESNASDRRKTSIWLSRYCFNPEETMSQLKPVLDPEAAEEESPAEEEPSSQEDTPEHPFQEQLTTSKHFPTTTTHSGVNTASRKTYPSRRKKKTSQPEGWKTLALPIGLVFVTSIFILLGIISARGNQSISPVCENSIGSENQCQLAVQLVGESILELELTKAIPFTPGAETQSLYYCEQKGNIRAGKTFKEVFQNEIPVLSSGGEEVIPGIYLAQVEQTNFKEGPPTVRTACAFRNTNYDVVLMNSDVIPNNWPEEPYEGERDLESIHKALGVYGIFILLGSGIIFNAIGIFVAAMSGLGIRVYSLESIYKGVFIFSVLETIASYIPGLNHFFIMFAVRSIILLIISGLIKDFNMDWTGGYKVVLFGVVVIVIVRRTLEWFLFLLILGLV